MREDRNDVHVCSVELCLLCVVSRGNPDKKAFVAGLRHPCARLRSVAPSRALPILKPAGAPKDADARPPLNFT